jgi:hypothetical protein
MKEIASCKIFPGIGIARVGNSPDQFFIGPEASGFAANPGGNFKDGEGRIKRQASRFRVYAFDDQDEILQELTSADAAITWTVHLANRKGSWYQFRGLAAEQKAREEGKELPLRNPNIEDRSRLVIDPGERSISGPGQGGDNYRFDGGSFLGTPVPLGELRTDEAGRLLVLGGFGHSDTVKPNNAIRSYANNDDWYDDTSDGLVTAKVVLNSGREVPLTGSSWVIVAPPDYSPATDNLITLYDVAEEAAVRRGWLAPPERISFARDIVPIFGRLVGYQWVNAAALRGHGPGKPGNLLEQLETLADNGATARAARQRVFQRLRTPAPADGPGAAEQANLFFMPQLSGDEGDQTEQDPTTWLTLLPSQYDKLRRWADGDFDADWPGSPLTPAFKDLPIKDQPAALNRAALEHSVGGPFFPGIEMTYISRDPDLYVEPFRLVPNLGPGDITKRMAVPWQADFYQCNTHWWPAQRPDDVVTENQFAAVFKAFEAEADNPDSDPAAMLFNRESWARGVEKNIVVPQPEVPDIPGETPEQHQQRVQDEWDRRRALAGDDGLVERWSRLGFVLPKTTPNGRTVLVETERERYFGLSDREYFYIMMNLDAYPDFTPTAKALVQDFLAQAWSLQSDPDLPDELRYFEYTPRSFNAHLDKIYNGLVAYAEAYSPANPDVIFKTRDQVIERIRQFAPFNQLDGAWLRNATRAGPINEVHSLLFAIWSDEAGNGIPELNHANLYTDLLHSVGIYPADISTQAYAYDPAILDSAYTSPLFQLVISEFSQSFFPEILGMTLNLEWEVLQLKTTIKLLEYFGINAQFYRMHVGIDNAVSGHGGKAKRAVELYLDQVCAESGQQEMQNQWKRIWNGYVAFATTGNLGQDLSDLLSKPPSLQAQMEELVTRKRSYGQLNHDAKRVGANLINDWFDDPPAFLQALQDSGMIVPGDPDNSPFFNLLRYNGPMYKVFTEDEIKLWADWTRSLVGGAPKPSEPDVGNAMVKLIETMRGRQQGNPGHQGNQLTGPDPANANRSVTQPVEWWFQQPATAFMAALANEQNGWVIKGNATNSRFITELAAGSHPMALALGGVVPGTPHKTWRSIVFDWINKGCPIPAPATMSVTAQAMAAPQGPVPRLTLSSPASAIAATPRRNVFGNGAIH